jgi:hypothetical protein
MQTESKYQLDDSFWPRWVKGLALLSLLAFIGYLAAHIYSWRLHGQPMRIGSIYLHNLHRKWTANGSPINPVVTNYVSSSAEDRYFVWTNHYTLGGSNFESQFGFEARFFLERGFLIISRDGRLAWIDKKTGPELVKP